MTVPTAKTVARTYLPSSYNNPWEAVLDHRRVLEYAAEHPNRGSQAIASALDLPPISHPTVDRRRRHAGCSLGHPGRRRERLARSYESDATKGLAGLIAWIFAGGSINQPGYAPYFAVRRSDRDESLERLRTVTGWYNVDLTIAERDDTDDQERAIEYRPAEYASILGRCLHVAGAPVGPKTEVNLAITI